MRLKCGAESRAKKDTVTDAIRPPWTTQFSSCKQECTNLMTGRLDNLTALAGHLPRHGSQPGMFSSVCVHDPVGLERGNAGREEFITVAVSLHHVLKSFKADMK